MEATTVGARIARARRSAGLSQEALARRFEVSKNTVARWEGDVHPPSLETVRMIAEVCGVDPRDLAYGPPEEGAAQ